MCIVMGLQYFTNCIQNLKDPLVSHSKYRVLQKETAEKLKLEPRSTSSYYDAE